MVYIDTFRDLWRLLDSRGRFLTCVLVGLLAISSAFEIVSMFFLFGYFNALNGTVSTGRMAFVTSLYLDVGEGLEGPAFALASGAVLVGVFLLKNVLWLLSSFFLLRFVMKRYERVATALFDGYQDMPLDLMRSRGTVEPAHILNTVLVIFRGAFVPLLQAFADVAVIVAMLVVLMWVIDPALVIGAGVVLGATAVGFLLLTRRLSDTLGLRMRRAQLALGNVTNEALRGILDVRLAGRQSTMSRRFHAVASEFALADRRVRALDMTPRALNEMVLAVGITLAAAWFAAEQGGMAQAIPTLAVLGFAGLRVTAAMARLTQALQLVRQSSDGRVILFEELERSAPHLVGLRSDALTYRSEDTPLPDGASAVMRDKIVASHLFFSYPGASRPALNDVSLEIEAGSFVAFCGPSGGGKSTLALALMGLLRPDSGSVTCDGWDVQRHLAAWHAQIGHVGQSSFIAPRSVRENVAFGVEPDRIDDAAVWRALEAAAIADLFRDRAEGLETMLGEDGALLSGGQRQRVAIGRALYGDPAVLVFDEATAALDTATEREVSAAISRLRGDRTIIAIAHRLSTIETADRIHLVECGAISASGRYGELIEKSDSFRSLAGATR